MEPNTLAVAIASGSPQRSLRARWRSWARQRPLTEMLIRRAGQGVIILFLVSIIIFVATMLLPGNVANAILGRTATPESIAALEAKLMLNDPPIERYMHWLGGVLSGNPGQSLANGQPLWELVGPRLINSAGLVLIAGVIGIVIGIALGTFAAVRRDRPVDHVLTGTLLVLTSLPEFVVAIILVIVFSTVVWRILPAVALLSSGEIVWSQPQLLILPIATLVIAVVPYIYRMTRAVTIENLNSDFVEFARLKGVKEGRVVMRHALINSVPSISQVTGIVLLYLAGGVVIVEFAFGYPGIGSGLVDAVAARDVPMVQFIVLLLAVFYVVVNIVTDLVSMATTPRRRYPR